MSAAGPSAADGRDDVLTRVAAMGIVPVVEVEREEDAVPLARTLADAGLPVLELTLRTPAALAAIALVAERCPDVLLGAGTLLDPATVSRAASAGAVFGVSPGLHLPSLVAAADAGLPFIPGVVTPSEVLAALAAGARHLKFFPAAAYGGAATLASVAAPVAHTGVRFMPTGGVTADDAATYLRLPAVFAVGGTWIAPRADITAGRWDAIAARARGAVALVEALGREAVA